MLTSPNRIVYQEDALAWLARAHDFADCSFVSSLPDKSEFASYTIDQWKSWFIDAAALVISRTPSSGVTIFYQSDIKVDGTSIDKGYLCQRAAEAMGAQLLWHKIACRSEPGKATYGRVGYSHLLCFSKNLRLEHGSSTPDVIPNIGEKTWERGMGLSASLFIADFIKQQTPSTTVVNPFCGQGSMLAAANAVGLSAIGIERSAKRAEISRQLALTPDGKHWVTA